MSTIFISHSSIDSDLAKRLERRLAREEYNSVFLDLDPEKGIVAGRSWERTLYRKLRACRVVIALCTNNYLGSHWCFAEIALARVEGKHVIALLAEPLDSHAKLPAILADKQFIDFRQEEDEGYRRLWRALKELELVGVETGWNPSDPPYLGLSAYQEQHAPVFIGREDELRAGVELLERGSPGLIMVLGSSGSGKSSLVRAGILPRLRPQRDHWLIVEPVRPSRDPFEELAESLAQTYRRYAPQCAAEAGDRDEIKEILEGADSDFRPSANSQGKPGDSRPIPRDDRVHRLIEQLDALRRDPPAAFPDRLRDLLDRSLDDLRRASGERVEAPEARHATTPDSTSLVDIVHRLRRDSGRRDARVLVIIDQFEELLGREDIDHRANRFLTLLRTSFEADHSPLLVLGTMRSDFLGQFQRNAALCGIDFESLSLGPMQIDGMRRVIEEPARLGSIEFEEGLADRLLEDTETADALPLLSFTLSVLWRTCGEGRKFTIRAYEELGGVQGAVASEADAILAAAKRQGKEADIRRALLQLARLTEDGAYARQPVSCQMDEMRRAESILDQFVKRRLLVVRGEGNSRSIEVAHEALFRSWVPLRTWLENARSELLLRQQVRRDAAAWEESGHSADTLWRGGRLMQAKELLGSSSVSSLGSAPSRETAFIKAGLRRRQRQRLTLGGATLAVIATLAGFLLFALVQADRARAERSRALDLAYVSIAGEQLERDPITAALILTEIEDPENTPFTKRRLSDVLRVPLVYAEFDLGAPAANASFSPDSSAVVTVTEDNNVRVWDVRRGVPLTEPLRHDSTVMAASVSPDGAVLFIADGNSARLWNIASGEQRSAEPWHHSDPVTTASFSPDGKLVATAAGNRVWLWDVASGERRFVEPWRHAATVSTASFSPDNRLVVTGCDDGNAWAWDVVTGKKRFTEPWKHEGKVDMVRFSPDGSLVLTRATSFAARVWDVETGEEKSSFSPAEPFARFSPNGDLVMTTNRESAHVWDPLNGKEAVDPMSHTPSPMIASWFSPDSETLLTASGHRYFTYWDPLADNMLRAWNLKTGELRFAKQLKHESEIMGAEFSPDGRFLLTRSGRRHGGGRGEKLVAESRVRVWILETEGERFSRRLPGGIHAFSPDGTLVATASGNTAQLWDVQTGLAQISEPLAVEQPIQSIAFSPDGSLVLAASAGAVQLWNAASGSERFEEPLSFSERLSLGSSSVLFSPDGQHLITEHYNSTVQAWDIRTGKPRFPEPPKYCGAPVRPRVSPNGKLLVTACGETARLWDIETGRERHSGTWNHASGYIRSVAFSPDGRRVITASDDRTARLWDVVIGKELHRLQHDVPGPYGVSEASFSPDGKRVVTASNTSTVSIIWDAETGDQLRKLEHPSSVQNAEFNATGTVVVTTYQGDDSSLQIRLWDAETGTRRSEIPAGSVQTKNWSVGPSGDYLVSWHEESARVWILETGEELFSAPLSHPRKQRMAPWMRTGDVRSASISPDGTHLITTTEDETRVWMISGKLLQEAVRASTVSCLSPGTRETLLGETFEAARAKYEACEQSYGRVP